MNLKENPEKIIAFCNDTPNAYSQEMYNEFLKYNITALDSKSALELVEKHKIAPPDIYVVQEILAKDAQKLIKLGAKPFVLTSGEAPIYAPLLYDNLKNITEKFSHRILYRGSFDEFGGVTDQNHILYFPTGSNYGNVEEIVSWDKRKEMVMVVANKFCRLKFPTTMKLADFIRKFKIFFSPSYRASIADNFQITRLNAIEYFGNLGKLDLYGRGWDKKKDIPAQEYKKIKSLMSKVYKGTCADKIDVISKYKFAVTFENLAYPGYVTEKIIDCFVAGVIPIYAGAPDVEDFIPKNCFIDFKDFGNFDELNNYLKNLDEAEAMQIIKNGREFLQTSSGQKYSSGYFVKTIAELFSKETAN